MRFDIHKVRAYLVNELLDVPAVVADVRDDGTDLIMADLRGGESILLYLIDRVMSINEITETLNENTTKGIYTLFILWGDMLLPPEDKLYLPEDWMETLYNVYGGKIYGYDSFAQFASVFPVYFEEVGQGFRRHIRYGEAIDAGQLHVDTLHVQGRYAAGYWRVADFEGSGQQTDSGQHTGSRFQPVSEHSISAYYAVLAVEQGADRDTIRTAYRRLARQYHPDVNQSPEAHSQMQRINEAYRHIMQYLEGQA